MEGFIRFRDFRSAGFGIGVPPAGSSSSVSWAWGRGSRRQSRAPKYLYGKYLRPKYSLSSCMDL